MDVNLKPSTYFSDFNLAISNKQLGFMSSNIFVMWKKRIYLCVLFCFFQKSSCFLQLLCTVIVFFTKIFILIVQEWA